MDQLNNIMLTPEDKEFFQRFYEDHIGLIAYFARRYSLGESDCDDLIQDVVLRLLRRIPSLRNIQGNPGKIAYYIRSTVQSAFIDHFWEDKNRINLSCPNEILDTIIEERLAAQRMPFDNSYWDVQLLKQKLPERDWLLLEGKHIIGYTDEELAKLYGCSKDSIRMALSRARKRARYILFTSNEEGGAPHA